MAIKRKKRKSSARKSVSRKAAPKAKLVAKRGRSRAVVSGKKISTSKATFGQKMRRGGKAGAKSTVSKRRYRT